MIMFDTVIVRRVHWRAHAQLMRWREEVTLTGYEMHWVVRYFLNKSQTWDHLISGTGTGGSTGTLTSNASIIAYARRKQQTWHNLAHSADRVFATINSAYKSPL